ncbi:hypothetical protein GCK72_013896 [Caenorhabditis remanei]|nr:hypothetical protein GCK72_013896 [Caenorhabditis remanei]KAF1757440.1 hypothetical protein GCK72_013896 [Caenorhabditis remanei]
MDEMTRLFSPSCWVPGKTRDEVMSDFFAGIQQAYYSLEKDQTIPRQVEVVYGEEENQKVDIWGEPDEKLLIFIHGGYWAAGTRKDCLTPARCSLNSGFAFASVGYGLATNGRSLTESVEDVIKGVDFILSKYPNVSKVIIGGHSAGAHLAVKAVIRLRNPRIQGMLLFSGCYFLEELVGTDIGNDINLTSAQAQHNSCDLSLLDGLQLKSLVILGLQEAPKLVQQNRDFVEKRKESSIAEFPSSGHYTIMTNLLNEQSDEYSAVMSFLEKI